MTVNYKQIYAKEAAGKKKWLSHNPNLTDESGIYILTREDEAGIRYAYVGQAVKILSRLSQHLYGYQHIDLSLKKHGIYSEENQHGWKANCLKFPEKLLDEKEKEYIKLYATNGYQLRNKTAGGQGTGKAQIDDYKPGKGYRDGIQQGRKNLARELKAIADKHLEIRVKPEKQGNKVSEKQYDKFMNLLKEDAHDEMQ